MQNLNLQQRVALGRAGFAEVCEALKTAESLADLGLVDDIDYHPSRINAEYFFRMAHEQWDTWPEGLLVASDQKVQEDAAPHRIGKVTKVDTEKNLVTVEFNPNQYWIGRAQAFVLTYHEC